MTEKRINEINFDDVLESIYSAIVSNMQKARGKGLGLIADLVVEHKKNISKCKHLSGSSYVKLIN